MTTTVLLVDDDPDILELMSALLTEEGFQTITCLDGIAALQAVRTQHPAVAIIDLEMPVIDGLELIEMIRKEPGEPLPIIVISGAMYAPPEEFLQVHAYFPKPFDLEELLEHVKYLTHTHSDAAMQSAENSHSLTPIRRHAPGTY